MMGRALAKLVRQVGASLAGGIQTDEVLSSSSVSLPAGLTRAFVLGKGQEQGGRREETGGRSKE
eukprot:768733-Hanusia_phi.AAC.4